MGVVVFTWYFHGVYLHTFTYLLIWEALLILIYTAVFVNRTKINETYSYY